jgi:hypothetical protein
MIPPHQHQKPIEHWGPRKTEDIHKIIVFCDTNSKLSDLWASSNVFRSISNTSLRVEALMSLRPSDVGPSGIWLHVSRLSGKGASLRVLPIFPNTHRALHGMNPQPEFILGDSPRRRMNVTFRILTDLALEFCCTKVRFAGLRLDLAFRFSLAINEAGLGKYLSGKESLRTALNLPLLTREEDFIELWETLGRYLDEL